MTIQTADFCGTKPRATKDHRLKAVTWNNIRKSVELPGLSQIIHAYVKGLPKTKRCNSVVVTVSVRFRCICETAQI